MPIIWALRVALHMVLKKLGKESTIIGFDDIPDDLKFIPTANEVQKEFNPKDYDLFLITDCGDPKLTGNARRLSGTV